MSLRPLRVRRANTDDFPSLRPLWDAMRLPADELEKRLTEFQVVELADGQIVGAIGVQIAAQHALLHNEGYTDYSVADEARELFWDRIQTIAQHRGVFRLWTQEQSPFWIRRGFQAANTATLERLPAEWKNLEGRWLTLELKNEDAINAALKNQFADFMKSERQQTERVSEQARKLKLLITVAGFGIFFICILIVIYLLFHNNPFPHLKL